MASEQPRVYVSGFRNRCSAGHAGGDGKKTQRKSVAAAFSKIPSERSRSPPLPRNGERSQEGKIAVIHRGQIGGRKWEFAACPVPGVGSVGSGSPGPGLQRGPDTRGSSIPEPRPELPGKEKQPRTESSGNFSPAFLRSHPSESCP